MRNTAQKSAAKNQMQFQERMSNTAHQRQIKDLKAAGLNPILSAKLGGASSPQGAMPQISDILTPAVSSAIDAKRAENDTNLKQAQTAVQQVEKILKENLIPGTESIKTMTENIRDLLKAASNLIGKDVTGYQETLQTMSKTMVDTLEYIKQKGLNGQQIMINLGQSGADTINHLVELRRPEK